MKMIEIGSVIAVVNQSSVFYGRTGKVLELHPAEDKTAGREYLVKFPGERDDLMFYAWEVKHVR